MTQGLREFWDELTFQDSFTKGRRQRNLEELYFMSYAAADNTDPDTLRKSLQTSLKNNRKYIHEYGKITLADLEKYARTMDEETKQVLEQCRQKYQTLNGKSGDDKLKAVFDTLHALQHKRDERRWAEKERLEFTQDKENIEDIFARGARCVWDLDTPEAIRAAIRKGLETITNQTHAAELYQKYGEQMIHHIENLPKERLAQFATKGTGLSPEQIDDQKQCEAGYAKIEAQNQALMDRWDRLNDAVGGDLFSNPMKLAAMRRVDQRLSSGDPYHTPSPEEIADGWDEFQEAVIAEIAIDMHELDKSTVISRLEREGAWALGLSYEDLIHIESGTSWQYTDNTREETIRKTHIWKTNKDRIRQEAQAAYHSHGIKASLLPEGVSPEPDGETKRRQKRERQFYASLQGIEIGKEHRERTLTDIFMIPAVLLIGTLMGEKIDRRTLEERLDAILETAEDVLKNSGHPHPEHFDSRLAAYRQAIDYHNWNRIYTPEEVFKYAEMKNGASFDRNDFTPDYS